MTEAEKMTNKEVIAYLVEKFPLCFSVDGDVKPLKVGISQDLYEALKDDGNVTKTKLRRALHQYTLSWRYLYACQAGAQRVDLQGNPAGMLAQDEVEHAAKKLAESKARIAQKRAEERAAERASKQETKKKHVAHRKPNNSRKNRLNLQSVVAESLQKGAQVKVKMGDKITKATVLEASKESARVELENGLTLTVSADRLFA